MANKKYLVVHPRLNMNVALGDEDKARVQRVPAGTELELDEAHAKSLIKAGKLQLATGAKKAKAEAKAKAEDKK